jgi:hypothetical protein
LISLTSSSPRHLRLERASPVMEGTAPRILLKRSPALETAAADEHDKGGGGPRQCAGLGPVGCPSCHRFLWQRWRSGGAVRWRHQVEAVRSCINQNEILAKTNLR